MAGSNGCWGIEVGAAAIKAVKIDADESGGRVLEFANIPHPKTLSSPDVNADDVLRVSLGTLVSQVDLGKAPIAISVPGHSAFARFAKLPPVEPKKVPDIVRFEAMQQIPFPLEEVEWDYQTFVSQDSPDVEVGIFAITRDRIQERLTLLADVGVVPEIVTLSPIAAYNALAYDLEFPAQTPGTIIVDVGTTATDLIIAEAGRVWVRTFPLGGHHFTEALVNAFKLSYSKAEKLKGEAQDTKHARQVFQAMRGVFTDLAQDIQRSIQYYTQLHRDAQLVRLIGLGSTFQLPGLRKFLKQQIGVEVYRVEEFKRLKTEALGDEARQKAFRDLSVNFATAYGLALQCQGLNRISANLMPVKMVREAMWKRKTPWFAAAAGLGVAAAGVMFIRPLMNFTAVSAAQPDPMITRVIQEADRLKGEATAAGVVGGEAGDARAATYAGLLANRALHAMLVRDMGAMLSSAETALPAWLTRVAERRTTAPGGQPLPPPLPGPAFTVTEFSTTFVPSGQPLPGAGGMAGMGGMNAGPDDPDINTPRIAVRMRVETTVPEARFFMIDTLQKWLRENATREGTPYRIVAAETPWTLTETSVGGDGPGDEGQRTAAGGGRAAGAPGAPAAGRERPGRAGGGPQGRPGRAAPGAEPEGEVMIIGGAGESGPPPEVRQRSDQRRRDAGELAQMAPLSSLRAPDDGAARTLSTFVVTWHVVIAPPPEQPK